MIGWIIAILIGLIVCFLLFGVKATHFKHRLIILFLLVVALFVVSSYYYVSVKNHLDLNSVGGFFKSVGVYFGWLSNGFNNVRTITGYAVHLDWSSTNSSIIASPAK